MGRLFALRMTMQEAQHSDKKSSSLGTRTPTLIVLYLG
jgi:hypothetical protein